MDDQDQKFGNNSGNVHGFECNFFVSFYTVKFGLVRIAWNMLFATDAQLFMNLIQKLERRTE